MKTLAVTSPLFGSPTRLVICAIVVPVVVAGTNQLLLNLMPHHSWLRPCLYPWMAFTTAVLSWSTGRYLVPEWFRWIVFGWCLVLLDVLTITACLTDRLEDHFGYVLVSAQISLLVLWTILAPVAWQWRLPAVLVAGAGVMSFSGSFTDVWWGSAWDLMMILTAAVVSLLSFGLRSRGFMLRKFDSAAPPANVAQSVQTSQFGLKHMLIWAAAVVPLLLVMRGADYFLFAELSDLESVFGAALVSVSLATVNLIAIWAILGGGPLISRAFTLVWVPPLIAACLMFYSGYVQTKYGRWPSIAVLDAIFDMHDYWLAWLWLDAALLAALLVFLRASGYRLIKTLS